MKDGIHFHFIFCLGVLLVAICTLVLSKHSKDLTSHSQTEVEEYHFFPTLGIDLHLDGCFVGALWCLGNVMSVPIVQRLGLGVGLSLWAGMLCFVT